MKLHLGCGSKDFGEGWTHIDVVDHPHIDVRCQVDRMPMIPDGSCSLVYACHLLEHFNRREVPRVLAEWRRVLKLGGILRLSVPDFAAIVSHYSEHPKLEDVVGLLFGRQDYLYNIHRTVFDRRTLVAALAEAGFQHRPKRYDWRKTEHAHVHDYSQAHLPHIGWEGDTPPPEYFKGRPMSLNMEVKR